MGNSKVNFDISQSNCSLVFLQNQLTYDSALSVTIGTTAAESLNAAGNIFLGQTEAPLLIRTFLPDMTK